MKVVVFAGGVGTRLWPLSRKRTPKQFEKIIGDRSTLQQTVDRLILTFPPSDIFIATGSHYEKLVLEQLPQIAKENFIFEPSTRDVGPAIGLAALILEKRFPNEPIAILWSDHLVKHAEVFRDALSLGEAMVKRGDADFVFIGQKPRFANQNVGWIELGKKLDEQKNTSVYQFKRLRYRPKLTDAISFFEDEHYVWNLGYFVTTPSFLTGLFKRYTSEMFEPLSRIADTFATKAFENTLATLYPTVEKISFDDAILEKLRGERISVISADLGWSDVGAWEALKEALAQSVEENVTKGNLRLEDCKDCLVFNYTPQLTVGIDLEEMLVINTNDVVLICPKSSVPKIKKLVESLSGTSHEHLT